MVSERFAAAQSRLAARRSDPASLTTYPSESATSPWRLAQLPKRVFRFARTWASSSPSSISPLRVGQLDAELLDEELCSLLRGQVADGLRLLHGGHAHDAWSAEINLALRAVLFKLTIWDHDATYGAALLGLRFIIRDASKGITPPSSRRKAIYGLVTVLGTYAWIRWESWLRDRDREDQIGSAGLTVRGIYSRHFRRVTDMVTAVYTAAALASFLVFLRHGRYRTLLERALGMRLAPKAATARREVSFEYQNRQLVWHAFTEFLLFALPLLGISSWRRWLTRIWRRTRAVFRGSPTGVSSGGDQDSLASTPELAFLPERTCAICYQDRTSANASSAADADMLALTASGGVVGSVETDVTNPYEAIPCCCVYCFVCLATSIDAEVGEGWSCLRCGRLVRECRPWSGDILEEDPTRGSGRGASPDAEGRTEHNILQPVVPGEDILDG